MTDVEAAQAATGQSNVEDALAWIAEGHPLKPKPPVQVLLGALVRLNGESQQAALRRVARLATESDIDTGGVIFNPELLRPLGQYKRVLDLLARKSPTRSLDGLTPEAVTTAHREDPVTMEVICAIAGLSFRDLKERLGDEIPNAARGRWSSDAIAAAFRVVDGIVRGTEAPELSHGAIALRPIELLLAGTSNRAWAEVERMRCAGVPYEWLLAQRTVGSAWGAHRNRTSSKTLQVIAERLCALLDQYGVSYRRSKSAGGNIRPSEVRRLAGGGSHVGLVVVNHTCQAIFGSGRGSHAGSRLRSCPTRGSRARHKQ